MPPMLLASIKAAKLQYHQCFLPLLNQQHLRATSVNWLY